MEKIQVGVLGGTGAVGQKLVRMLVGHPWFEVGAISGSERSIGKEYGSTLRPAPNSSNLPADLLGKILVESTPQAFSNCRVVFSALQADVARELEPAMAASGLAVVSNASAHRMLPDVPLIVPEVNSSHSALIRRQQEERVWKGFLVTNPNCSTIVLTMALAPLQERFGLESVFVTTLQAVSGAGFNGVGALDMIDNIIPYIGGEEDKMETEPLKLLSEVSASGSLVAPDFRVSAQCTRVPTTDGHMEMVSVKLREQASAEEITSAWRSWNPLREAGLPTSPQEPIIVRSEPNRPQTRFDRDAGGGMAATVGRLRPCPLLDYKFALLGHNLVRGAAGGVLLIAEMLKVQGYLD